MQAEPPVQKPLPAAILIAGPTASGKSALAMQLAAERGGVVINADSMQVYRDLRILSARPSATDEVAVPHALFGHVDGAEAYSTGRYIRDLEPVLDRAMADGLRPIIIGGTGLYFRAILEGLSPVPEIPDEVRARWRQLQRDAGADALHAILATRDPEMAARLRPSDPQRIVRALEVLDATGRSLASWQAQPGTPMIAAEHCERVLITGAREEVCARAERRFAMMMDGGALDEVRNLIARDLGPALPVMRALGVPQLARHLAGEVTLDAAVGEAVADTRGYIKRQLTWAKRNMADWKALDMAAPQAAI